MSIMTTDLTKTVKLFFCYAREDRALRDELEQHLSLLKRQKQITTWYDREISPGTVWEKEIERLEDPHAAATTGAFSEMTSATAPSNASPQ